MKNLITKIDFLKLPLPKHEAMGLGEEKWDRGRHGLYHPIDNVWPQTRVENLCEKNIGKPFDKIFSKYCSQVPVYQQHFFLEEFEEGRRRYHWPGSYYIDDNKNIQKRKEEKKDKRVWFRSDDCKSEKLHKVTFASYPEWFSNKYRHPSFNEDDYDYFIVEGFVKEFSSKNDPEYKRLTCDQNQRKEAEYRRNCVIENYYSFVTDAEKEAKEEKARNRVKIEGKGFDYETSFRNDNQINRDIIKEKQGF